MTTIKTSTVLVDFKGQTLKNNDAELTAGDVISSILGGKSSNPTLAWQLGKKFATEKSVELKAEDVVFLKKEVEDNQEWFSVVRGQLIELLDGKSEK